MEYLCKQGIPCTSVALMNKCRSTAGLLIRTVMSLDRTIPYYLYVRSVQILLEERSAQKPIL